MLSRQPDREAEIRSLLGWTEFTADEVAKLLGCSRSAANHVLRKAEMNAVVRLVGTDNQGWSKTNLWRVVPDPLPEADEAADDDIAYEIEKDREEDRNACAARRAYP